MASGQITVGVECRLAGWFQGVKWPLGLALKLRVPGAERLLCLALAFRFRFGGGAWRCLKLGEAELIVRNIQWHETPGSIPP